MQPCMEVSFAHLAKQWGRSWRLKFGKPLFKCMAAYSPSPLVSETTPCKDLSLLTLALASHFTLNGWQFPFFILTDNCTIGKSAIIRHTGVVRRADLCSRGVYDMVSARIWYIHEHPVRLCSVRTGESQMVRLWKSRFLQSYLRESTLEIRYGIALVGNDRVDFGYQCPACWRLRLN